jgi:hypothetical protein
MITSDHGLWSTTQGWIKALQPVQTPTLLLVFGYRAPLQTGELIEILNTRWPEAVIMGCSTAGQIHRTELREEEVVVTAWHFEQTRLHIVEAPLTAQEDAYPIGMALAQQLHQPELAHVLVLADGLTAQGNSLVEGLEAGLPQGVLVSGGLAGDGTDFKETVICTSQGVFRQHVAALGFYGKALHVGCSACGGWDPFGIERVITRSIGNEIFEMDGQPALDLYAKYLGPFASGLPATGLLFPLEIRQGHQTFVRTIHGINAESGSLLFTSHVPEGAHARLMKTNIEHLIDGAAQATQNACQALPGAPQAALLVSCVGRKMVLKQRTEEELEEVQHMLSLNAAMAGFYSYGEIAPGVSQTQSELHNQTMTITVFAEGDA